MLPPLSHNAFLPLHPIIAILTPQEIKMAAILSIINGK